MSDSVLNDEIDFEKHAQRVKENENYRRGDWTDKIWENGDNDYNGIKAYEIFDVIYAVSSVHYQKHKYKYETLIITNFKPLSLGYENDTFAGIGRMYCQGLYYPCQYAPEHMTDILPFRRYLPVGFTLTHHLPRKLVVENLCFCEKGDVLSKYNPKTNHYRVELPWV